MALVQDNYYTVPANQNNKINYFTINKHLSVMCIPFYIGDGGLFNKSGELFNNKQNCQIENFEKNVSGQTNGGGLIGVHLIWMPTWLSLRVLPKKDKEEVDLRGSKGIPSDFMSKADQEARTSLGVRPDDESQMGTLWPDFERNMRESNQLLTTGSNGQRLPENDVKQRVENTLEQLFA